MNNTDPESEIPLNRDLAGRRVLVAVSGGIAAYKTVEVVRLLLKRGAEVRVMMTDSATRFVHPGTFAAITGNRVGLSLWGADGEPAVDHLEMPHWAELIVVAPATANLIAKMNHGLADDLVSTAMLAAKCPILVAPAMNPSMWLHPATRENMRRLEERGLIRIGPDSGEMAVPGEPPGDGRMSEPAEIVARIVSHLTEAGLLSGRTVLITAGRTEEPIDRVRVLTNRSSGRMGIALAEVAQRLGAEVLLVHGAMDVAIPPGVCEYRTPTAIEMLAKVKELAGQSDLVFFVAAVADWRPANPADGKLKRAKQAGGKLTLELVENPDIAAETAPLVKGAAIGFALEVGDELAQAREKRTRKSLDAILFNRVENLGAEEGELTWVTDSETVELGYGLKRELAERVLRRAASLLTR